MPFPQSPLAVRVDLNLAGTWTNVTSDALSRDQITITRGRADEASRADPSTCKLTLKNQSGKFSARNPLSPYYGLLGRNTPLRVGVGVPPAGAGTPGQSGTAIDAPSVTAEVAGTLFAAWAASPVGNFTGPGGFAMYTERDGSVSTWAGGSKSVGAGVTGTSTATFSASSTAAAALSVFVPGTMTVVGYSAVASGAVGVGVAAAAGDYLLAVYGWDSDPTGLMALAPADIDGGAAWTLIADTGASAGPRVKAFIRRVPTASASLTVGFFGDLTGHASPEVHGRVWVLTGATDYYPRFTGEVSEWPARWDLSGKDVWVPISAAGITRRLGQGDSPLHSTIQREITSAAETPASSITAYWPMEDAAGATVFASALPAGPAMRFLGDGTALNPWPAPGADDGFVASEAVPTFTGAGAAGNVPAYPLTGTGQFLVGALISLPASGMTDSTTLLSVSATGTIRSWSIKYVTGGVGGFGVQALDAAGAVLTSTTFTSWSVPPPGARFYLYLTAAPSGADVSWQLMYIPIVRGADVLLGYPTTPATIAAATAGRVTNVSVGAARDLTGDPAIGHVIVSSSPAALFTVGFFKALVGWSGENTRLRVGRLAQEEQVPVYLQNLLGTTAMGPQRPAALLDLLGECEDVDGVLFEPRGFLGLAYRIRPSLYNQAVALALSYSGGQVAEPLEPTDDDRGLVNDVTVTRPGGSSARATLDVGALSTQAPPAGVGRYDTSVTVNAHSDDDLPDHAAWRVHLGTWDEARYPAVSVDLAHDPGLIPTVAALDVGDRVTISGLPAWLPPDDVDLIAEGFTETLGHPNDWDITVNCVPAGPYRVAVLDSATYGRLDAEDSTLYGALSTTTATTVNVNPGAAPWITTISYPTEFPFDVIIGGEQMTVTAITWRISDAFSRTTSNGWGSADAGGAWTVTGGVAGDYSVGSGRGAMALTGTTVHSAYLVSPSAAVDIYADIATNQIATGAALNGFILARSPDTSNYYSAQLIFTTAGTLTLQIFKRVAGTPSALGTYLTGITYATGTFYRVRLRVVGSTLQAKAWVIGQPEPTGWQLSVTDTALTAADNIGCRAGADAGTTNVGAEIRFDNFVVVNLQQTFTLTRSVNGIAKTHAAGEQVRLADPVYVAI